MTKRAGKRALKCTRSRACGWVGPPKTLKKKLKKGKKVDWRAKNGLARLNPPKKIKKY